MALFVDLVALSNGLHGSVQMDSVVLFSWIGWLRHHGIPNQDNTIIICSHLLLPNQNMYTIPLSYMAFESNDIYNERKIFNSIKYTKKDHGINP